MIICDSREYWRPHLAISLRILGEGNGARRLPLFDACLLSTAGTRSDASVLNWLPRRSSLPGHAPESEMITDPTIVARDWANAMIAGYDATDTDHASY